MPKTRETLTHSSYTAMLQRCNNPAHADYYRYGGRGISVCDRWSGPRGYTLFRIDMGLRPVGKTLDRTNNEGNYEPSNCRWSTPKEQARNTRTNHYVYIEGKRLSLIEAAEQLGINIGTVRSRMYRGMSDMEALTTPLHHQMSRGQFRKVPSITKSSHLLSFNGELVCLTEAARRLLIPIDTVRLRMSRGMSDVEALLSPLRSDDPRERNELCRSVHLKPV